MDYGAVQDQWHVEDLGTVEIPDDPADTSSTKFSWRKLWAYSGPGWLMSIAYLDPGNLESDLQAGAVAGYQLIWVLFWATILGCVLQVLSARLGVVTGKNLAELCRLHYSKPVSLSLWVLTEIAIIGSDIQEVIGSAIALNILFGLPYWAGVLLTAADTFTFLFLSVFGVRKLEGLVGALIACMVACFFWEFALGSPDLKAMAMGLLVPRVDRSAVNQAVGMVGAVIMPHNIFLHSALVQTRNIDRTKAHKVAEANYYYAVESVIALAVSFLINVVVVAVFAKGFFLDNTPNTSIGLFEAGEALRDQFGRVAEITWAVGLLAAGQSSTMTGTFAGQFVMQGFLDLHVSPWVRTMVTRLVAIVPTIIVAVAFASDFDTVNQFLNVLQSIQLPFALLPLITFFGSSAVVGDYKLSARASVGFAASILLVVGINVYIVLQTVLDASMHWAALVSIAGVGAAYLSFVAYLSVYDRVNTNGFGQHSKYTALSRLEA